LYFEFRRKTQKYGQMRERGEEAKTVIVPLRENSKGSVFLSTMIAILIIVIVGAAIFSLTSQDLFFVNRLKKSTQARHIAEAGLSAVFAKLKSNWSANAIYASTPMGSGDYQATVATSSGRTLVNSIGTVQGISRSVTAEVVPAAVSAFNYALASGGNATIDSGTASSPGTITGSIYSAGNTTLDGPSSGGVLQITGNIDAGQSITTSSSVNVSGTQTPGYGSSVPFPSVDLSYYQAIAAANGTYYAGSKVYSDASPIPAAPTGGVIYIGGSCTVYGTQSTNATIVVGGSMTIQKTGNTYPRATLSKSDSMPALVVMGNFAFQSSGNGGAYLTVTGLIYTGGNFDFQSGNHDAFTLTGSIISLGNITISPQSFNVLTTTYSQANPPGFTTPPSQFGVESYNT